MKAFTFFLKVIARNTNFSLLQPGTKPSPHFSLILLSDLPSDLPSVVKEQLA